MSAQARVPRKVPAKVRRPLVCLAAVLCLPLAACTSSGRDLSQDLDPAQTAEIAGAQASAPEQVSDQATIRNAVSSADLEGLGGQPLAWANSDTGSRGAITALAEERHGERLCRRFTTSRESFDGVALYRGEACMAQAGIWKLLDFKPI